MKSKRRKQMSYVFEKFNLLFRKPPSIGWTEFAPLRVVPEYIDVNVETEKVTGVVRYEGIIYLTVDVDVRAGKMKVTGSLRGIKKMVKPFKKQDYIKMIEDEAQFLVGKQQEKLGNHPPR